MLPSSHELVYFLEVANCLNLSRASERIGISQPSLSLSMQKLEKSMGTKLLIRHKQGVTLTQAGKQLLLHSRQLMEYWEKTLSYALASEKEVQGHFSLGCHSTIAIHIVSIFLPDLLNKYPKLQIHLKHDISRKITEQVINLSIDMGIVANPIKHPDLIIRKLCNDEVTFWISKELQSHNIDPQDIVILCDPELTQTQTLLKKAERYGIVSKRLITTPNLEVIANLTAAGCGMGILPGRVAKSLYPDQLIKIPKMPIYHDELCLIYRNENRSVQAIQTIVQAIRQAKYT